MTPEAKKTEALQLAREIAVMLFTAGTGKKAHRLHLVQESGGAVNVVTANLGGWSEQAAADRIAEVLGPRLAQMEARKDAAYLERNQCVAGLAALAEKIGYDVGTARTAIEGWSEDWYGCIYIDLPTGQVSWHFHDSQAHLFSFLPAYEGKWDGHDTEEKYRRVAALGSPSSGGGERREG